MCDDGPAADPVGRWRCMLRPTADTRTDILRLIQIYTDSLRVGIPIPVYRYLFTGYLDTRTASEK